MPRCLDAIPNQMPGGPSRARRVTVARGHKPNSVPVSNRLATEETGDDHSSTAAVADDLQHATRPRPPTLGTRGLRASRLHRERRLLALARGGVYRAPTVTSRAVRSYRTFSPLPVSRRVGTIGGVFSVALSLAPRPRAGGRYPPPCPVVFGLSSVNNVTAIVCPRRIIDEP